MEIILKIDKNKNAHILKPTHILKLNNMKHMECIHLLIGAAIWYYKEYNEIASINEAAVEIGKGLIQSVDDKV